MAKEVTPKEKCLEMVKVHKSVQNAKDVLLGILCEEPGYWQEVGKELLKVGRVVK